MNADHDYNVEYLEDEDVDPELIGNNVNENFQVWHEDIIEHQVTEGQGSDEMIERIPSETIQITRTELNELFESWKKDQEREGQNVHMKSMFPTHNQSRMSQDSTPPSQEDSQNITTRHQTGDYANVFSNLKNIKLIVQPMNEGKTEPLEKLFEWCAYERRLRNGLQMSNEMNDKAKYMILESTGGREVTNALLSIEKEKRLDPKNRFESAITALHQFFSRGVTQVSCRMRLKTMKQNAGETFTSFAARIKTIVHMMQDVFDIEIAEIEILMALQEGAKLGKRIGKLMTVNQYGLSKIEAIIPIIEAQEKEAQEKLSIPTPAIMEEVVNKLNAYTNDRSMNENSFNQFPNSHGSANFNGNRGNAKGYFRGNYRGNFRGNFRGSSSGNQFRRTNDGGRGGYKRSAYDDRDDSSLTCWNCGGIGHRSAKCFKRRNNDKIYEIKNDVSENDK